MEEIRNSLQELMAEQTARITEATRQQNLNIAEIRTELLKCLKGKSPQDHEPPGDVSNAKISWSIKVDMPRFTGEGVEGWLFQASEYFEFHGIGEESKIKLCSFYMSKAALDWFRGMKQNNLISTWSQFKIDVREHFGDSYYVDKLQLLSRLQQNSSVGQYQEEFEQLMNEVHDVSEQTLICYFIGGLKPQI